MIRMESLREQLIDRIKTLQILPTLDGVVEKLFSILDDKDSSFRDLNDVIKYDQAISSKVISIANSAYYSRGVEILSLQRAMITIGYEEVKNIVTCMLFVENILKELKLRPDLLMELWKHSVHVACAARVLAGRIFTEDPQKVFTVALLHDIGKVILYMVVRDAYSELVRDAVSKGKSLNKVEIARFGTDHEELGYILSVKWRFPEEFTQVIKHHHDGAVLEKYQPLLKLVRAADRFSTASTHDADPEAFILLKEREEIMKEVQKIMNFFQLNGHETN
ncbi:MAG: phosphodiesterase [Syntrophorhabdus sp. PtaU1.Bin153]|nr:MAG: phosphodiesterase [Syntrophorhabdus sp. PtaU1.Bin153]